MKIHVHTSPLVLYLLCLIHWSLVSCTELLVPKGPALDKQARWALLPIVNNVETPQAGERAEAILSTVLRGRGITNLSHYPALKEGEGLPELDDQRRVEAALAWAKRGGFTYAVTGSVQEWRYKSGLDAEPVVGVSLEVVDLATGAVVWSASGARSGWGRESVAGTAQLLLRQLVEPLNLQEGDGAGTSREGPRRGEGFTPAGPAPLAVDKESAPAGKGKAGGGR